MQVRFDKPMGFWKTFAGVFVLFVVTCTALTIILVGIEMVFFRPFFQSGFAESLLAVSFARWLYGTASLLAFSAFFALFHIKR